MICSTSFVHSSASFQFCTIWSTVSGRGMPFTRTVESSSLQLIPTPTARISTLMMSFKWVTSSEIRKIIASCARGLHEYFWTVKFENYRNSNGFIYKKKKKHQYEIFIFVIIDKKNWNPAGLPRRGQAGARTGPAHLRSSRRGLLRPERVQQVPVHHRVRRVWSRQDCLCQIRHEVSTTF